MHGGKDGERRINVNYRGFEVGMCTAHVSSPGAKQEDKRATRATASCKQPGDINWVNKEAVALADHGL